MYTDIESIVKCLTVYSPGALKFLNYLLTLFFLPALSNITMITNFCYISHTIYNMITFEFLVVDL